MPVTPPPLSACTIVSKNYLAYARVLCRSFLEHHPEGRFFVLLVDRNDGHIDVEKEPYELVEAEELGNVPEVRPFLFKYTILEANTAFKPFFLEYLVERHDLPNLVYFDPDILITSSLDELAGLVAEHSIVLTPHLTDPIDDGAYPGEQAILQSGSYNLGFVALRTTDASCRLLRWWQDRLYDQCVVNIPEGLFVDQKWMDLAPGLFGDVFVLDHPGYNVAYWNLHGRTVTVEPDGPRSNGQPLVFFHFSGIRPDNLEPVSKHQDRFRLSDIGEAAELYRLYADKVMAAGFRDCQPWPYAYARFDNGVPIPDAARSLYLGLSEKERQRFGDPFAVGEGSFFEWLNSSPDGQVSRFLSCFYDSRPDLQFGDIAGAGFQAYADWMLHFGRHELRLHDAFVEPMEKALAGRLKATDLRSRLRLGLKRLYHSPPSKAAKAGLRRVLGAERMRGLKERIRPPRPPAAVGVVRSSRSGGVPIVHEGVNLVGYLSAETGMGEAARGLAKAFEKAGIPLSLHDLELGVVARRDDPTFAGAVSDFPHDINLFVLNADQVLHVHEHLGAGRFAGRHNIGYWLWEQEDFPPVFHNAFDPLDEIWTSSSFCVDALSGPSPVPVRKVPLPVREAEAEAPHDSRAEVRAEHGIPEGAFVYFFMFNYLSHFERKNPAATVRAFRRAFGDRQDRVLLLKTSQRDHAPERAALLEAEIGDAENIRLFDAYLERSKIDDLLRASDAFVSLHRSEGFGLGLAEAMVLERPVVATAYSGVDDFFGISTGWPVRYSLVELEEDQGPYPTGSRWAEPDLAHAAEQMQRVADDAEERRRIVEAAARKMADDFSTEAVARRLRRLYDDLLRRQPPLPAAGMGRD